LVGSAALTESFAGKRKLLMRYFELLGIQHFTLYLFPAIAFIALFVIGLGTLIELGVAGCGFWILMQLIARTT